MNFCLFLWKLFDFFKKLLRLLLNSIEVTTEHQKWPIISTNSVKSYFFAQRAKKASAKGQSPLQELEVGLRSGPYLLVLGEKVKIHKECYRSTFDKKPKLVMQD